MTPITGELEFANLSIEKSAAASGDDAPTEEVSFNYGQLNLDYFGGTSGAAESGIESGAGRDLLVGGLGSDNTETSAAGPEAAGPMKNPWQRWRKPGRTRARAITTPLPSGTAPRCPAWTARPFGCSFGAAPTAYRVAGETIS